MHEKTKPEPLTAAAIAEQLNVTPERAAAILEVMNQRNVSPHRAVELLESAAWHAAIEAGRESPAAAPAAE